MQLIAIILITITITLTSFTSSFYDKNVFVIAQETNSSEPNNLKLNLNDVQDLNDSSTNNTQSNASIQLPLPDINQSAMAPDPIRDHFPNVNASSEVGPQGPPGPAGEVGPQGPPGPAGEVGSAGNNSAISKDQLYIKNGMQGSTSENSVISVSATCNDGDIPLNGGYSVVRNEEDQDIEIQEIESLPNLQNNSWIVNVEGDDIRVTPYVT
ncbi:hypothetical protein [Candidatus Nitrosocosmicus hydrocola]|uniref:hypothetical protein n=1 Tax=Candidatus Nitrosocosmicus hydrocola TaxID=1826872 RepID=UPI0015D04F37|nr:hypothetical protein [Candidatus Nitrosocosmicus hydrocola]